MSDELKRHLPIWFHIGLKGVKNVRINSPQAICQRKNHGIMNTGEMWALANNTDTRTNLRHKKRRNCACM